MRILFFFHLFQDIDVMLPMLQRIISDKKWEPIIWITDRLYSEYPEFKKILILEKIKPRIISYVAAYFGIFPSLKKINSVVTASESSQRSHRVAHNFVKIASKKKIRSYTLQHGFEQPGLTFFLKPECGDQIEIASDVIFTWGRQDAGIGLKVPKKIKERCVPVGFFKKFSPRKKTNRSETLISIFENFHWDRYDDNFFKCFIDNFLSTANRFPEVKFLLKPHPGRSCIRQIHKNFFKGQPNIVMTSESKEWKSMKADELISISNAVITTPSTIILDALMAGVPAAVAIPMQNEGYPFISSVRSYSEWVEFINKICYSEAAEREIIERQRKFLNDNVVAGDPIRKMIEYMKTDLVWRS